MRLAIMVLMALVCAAQTACVSQHETIPPETRAELIRLGRIITDENKPEEDRCNTRIRYCDFVRETIEKYGKKSVDRQTVIDSFVVDGRNPQGLMIEVGMLDYMFERRNGTFATLTILFGGWTGSYVQTAYSGAGIP